MDTVGVAILRMHEGNATIAQGRVFDQHQFARAAPSGLRVRGPDQIDLVTDDPVSRKVAEGVQDVLRRG